MNTGQTTRPKPVAPASADLRGEPSPKHSAHAVRRLAAIFLLALGGCGGGSSSESGSGLGQAGPPNADNRSYTARVFPARAGLVLVDRSAEGVVLQQSMPTDGDGIASFDVAIAGSRVQATSKDTEWRVPRQLSARLLGDGQPLELTPLTTIFDQFAEAGLSEANAQDRLYGLLAMTCAVTPQTLPAASMYGDHPLDAPVREWLLAALGAYVAALGRLGLSPDTPGIDWPALLGAHAELLTQLCDTARTAHAAAWQASAADALASRHGLAADAANAVVGSLRPQALALVLGRVTDRIAVLQHPSLSATLEAQLPEWIGNPPDQVASLIDAALARSATSGAAVATSMAGMALDRQGRIVQTISGQTMWTETDSPPVRFVNRAAETRSVSLTINGIALDSMADLIFGTLALPAEHADEPLQRRAWRYVVKASAHETPVTYGSFLHQAELFLRSVGRGFCDDVTHALTLLWQAMGYEARVWGLNGHVVPEVSVDGRWELYDPDYRVYYLNRQAQIASVADLENDATLITSPLLRLSGAVDGAYSGVLVDIYTSAQDNSDESLQANVTSPSFGPTLDLPAGAALEVYGVGVISVQTAEPSTAYNYKAAALKLQLPPGFTGTVRLSYVLTDITGDGRLIWAGESTNVPTQGLASSIAQSYQERPSAGITSVVVEQVGPRGLTLTMMVNPSLAPFGATLSARLTGPSVDGIELSVVN